MNYFVMERPHNQVVRMTRNDKSRENITKIWYWFLSGYVQKSFIG